MSLLKLRFQKNPIQHNNELMSVIIFQNFFLAIFFLFENVYDIDKLVSKKTFIIARLTGELFRDRAKLFTSEVGKFS